MNKLPAEKRYAMTPGLMTKSWRWMATSRFRQSILVVGLFAAVASTVQASPNVLVNGDFESYPQSSMANNIPGVVTPWVVGGGQQPNVVKVLANGSYHYKAGPWRDASNTTGNGPRHYLDITQGHNDIYQSFIPPCNGEVEFGGFFSSRSKDDGTALAGTGSVRIVQGVGTTGTTTGTTLTVNLPAGHNAHTDPWTPTPPATANVVGGQTYSFVVTMDNDVNFDEAYVRYKVECNVSPTPSPTAGVTPSPTVKPSPSPSPSATATPSPTPIATGCGQVADKDVRCESGGGYSYTFTATNNTGSDISQILLTPVSGNTFTLSPQLFNLSAPLHNGQSTALSATIGNAKPGGKVCFFVTLMSDKAACCTVQVCPFLPVCDPR
jgi:hypothetical protein